MKLNETTLSFLEVDSIQQFGKKKENSFLSKQKKFFKNF